MAQFQVVRDSLLLHAGTAQSHDVRITETRMLLERMEKASPAGTTNGSIWKQEAVRMGSLPDYYLAHEVFEENNSPCTFLDFARHASRYELSYLCETRISANIPENSSAERATLIRDLAQGDLVSTEQYIDIVTGRTFREALLIHSATALQVDRTFNDERFISLHFVVPPAFKLNESERAACVIVSDETEIDVLDPDVAAAVRELVQRSPATSTLEDLVPVRSLTEETRSRVSNVLISLVCRGLIDVVSEPIASVAASDQPRVCELAANDARCGYDQTATLRHTLYELTPFARGLLPYLDGTRDQATLIDLLADFAASGSVRLTDASGDVEDPMRVREIVTIMLEREIENLGRAAMFV